jgi:hypothetical protein
MNEKKTILDWALEYHKLGLCVIPVPHGKKAARIRWGKYQGVRTDESQLRKWFANNNRNIAVVLGPVSDDLACRDFDTMAEYDLWAKEYPDLAKRLPTVKTGNGMHVYFQADAKGRKDIEDANGGHLGELRGSGHYCLLPPSVHPDGPTYQWVNPLTNGNLPRLEPESAGFVANVTEQAEQPEKTEHTEQTEAIERGEWRERCVDKRRKTKTNVKVESEVEEAIIETLPQEVGTRNRQIFEFARTLNSSPQYADADPRQLRDMVRAWHERALPRIRTKEFEETWIDFLKAWPRIRHKKGEEPMAQIFERAIQLEPPGVAVENYPDHNTLKILVSLCRELQQAAGDNPFFLSSRTAGRLLNVTPMTANRWLFLLQSDGILKLVSKGGTATTVRKASRYRYVGG